MKRGANNRQRPEAEDVVVVVRGDGLLETARERADVEPGCTAAAHEDVSVHVLTDRHADLIEAGTLGLQFETVDPWQLLWPDPEVGRVRQRHRDANHAMVEENGRCGCQRRLADQSQHQSQPASHPGVLPLCALHTMWLVASGVAARGRVSLPLSCALSPWDATR